MTIGKFCFQALFVCKKPCVDETGLNNNNNWVKGNCFPGQWTPPPLPSQPDWPGMICDLGRSRQSSLLREHKAFGEHILAVLVLLAVVFYRHCLCCCLCYSCFVAVVFVVVFIDIVFLCCYSFLLHSTPRRSRVKINWRSAWWFQSEVVVKFLFTENNTGTT